MWFMGQWPQSNLEAYIYDITLLPYTSKMYNLNYLFHLFYELASHWKISCILLGIASFTTWFLLYFVGLPFVLITDKWKETIMRLFIESSEANKFTIWSH
jgi:hypothetical protein